MKARFYWILPFLFLCFNSSAAYSEMMCIDTSSTSSSGTLYDSGGPYGYYASYQNCGFLIQSTGGDITLSFSQFRYENNYDFLYVYDGTNSSGTLLGTFTGSSTPPDVTATSGAMYIVHTTDFSIVRQGFAATWTTNSTATAPLVEWRFDEESWNGSAGEVTDNRGVLSGFAVNGASTSSDGQVCGSAYFDGVDDYLSVSGISTYLKTTASLSFWMKTSQTGNNTSWLAPGVTGVEQAGGADDIFWGWLDASGRVGINKGDGTPPQSSSSINNGSWQHIVLTRDASSGVLQVYVNGVLSNTATDDVGDIGVAFNSLGRIEDTGGTPNYFSGSLDEVLIFDSVISSTTVQTIYNNQLAGNSWDGSARSCSLDPVAEWRLEESGWNGSNDEVIDSSGNAHHGRLLFNATPQNSSPAIVGSSGTCDYGNFSSGSMEFDSLPVSSSNGGKTTVTFWMKWDGTNSAMPIGWHRYDLWFYNGHFGFNTWNTDIYGISSSSLSGGWHHITAEFTNGSNAVTSNKLWVDGVQQTLTQRLGNPSSYYRSAGSSFRIGGATNTTSYHFSGDIDEVRIYNGSLSTSQVQTIMNETHPCDGAVPDYFSISHDNNAIYCLNETLSVSAHNSDTSILSTYSSTVTLDTQTGSGTWSLVSGNGALLDSISNDGLASYTFSSSDNGTATFSLSYTAGNSSVDIDAYDGSIRDDDSEGLLNFASSGFTVTANALSNPPAVPINDPVSTQTSGQAFTIHLAAYGTNPDDGTCGIIETYTGNKNITVAANYINPSSGTLNAAGSGTINFNNGQASVATQYDDVGQVSLIVTDTAASIQGSSNNFVVKPADFSIAVTGNPSTTTTGSGFVAAGEAFTVDVQALNAQGSAAPNYGNEAVPESVILNLDSLVFPSGGDPGTLNNANSFTKVDSTTLQNTTISWSEVGTIRLNASVADGDYLGTGNITSTVSSSVGRFYPDRFFLSSESVINQCTQFTYLSAPALSINYTLSAVSSDNNTVTNYDAGLGYPVGALSYHAELENNGTDLGSRLTVASAAWQAGEYSVSDNAAVFARSNSREAPLNAVNILLGINDVDDRQIHSVDMNASTTGDCLLDSSCDSKLLGNASFYFGRLRLPDAYGPETAALPVSLTAQYWNGSKFVVNTNDSCTAIPRTAVSFNSSPIVTASDLSVDLSGGTTSAQFTNLGASNINLFNGDAGLQFSAPGLAITSKSFAVDIDLTSQPWLRSDWNQDGDENNDTQLPTATISFKTYRGHDRILYWRHKY